MFSKIMVLTLSVLVSSGALAQTTAPAEKEVVGVVTGDNVYVRSEPGNYPCTKLSSPERVRVMGRRDGWLQITPPQGCHSLIAKGFVSVVDNVGTVTGTDVQVRAGSKLFRDRADVVQTSLNTGDKVTILGEQEGYYQITPPPAARLWIASKYVERLAPDAETDTPQTTTLPADVETTTQPEVIKDERSAFNAAERALIAEFQKPREQRNLQELLAKYQAIKPSADSPIAQHVKGRINLIQNRIELARNVQDAANLVRDAEARQAELAAERDKIKTTALTTMPARSYAAEGVLNTSELFTGGATGPKRYLIRDADTHLITAYVQCTTGAVDLAEHAGARVGVIGSTKYDEPMRLYIIEAEKIVVLQPAPPKPAPKPEPKPEPEPLPEVKPAPEPEPEPLPEVKPAPEPEPEPLPEVKPAPEPEPEPLPEVKPATEPEPEPLPEVKPAPEPEPEPLPEVKPAPEPAPEPTTQPAPEPEPAPEPTTQPAPEPEPTTEPATEPLPETGLPVVEPTTQPDSGTEVDPKEYD